MSTTPNPVGYCVRNDGVYGWRLGTKTDCLPNEVFSSTVPDDYKPSKADLIAYALVKAQALASGGTVLNGISIDTSPAGMANLYGIYAVAQSDSKATFPWYQTNGVQTLTSAQVIEMAVTAGNFINSAFVAMAAVDKLINSGKYKTYMQIDAYSYWPVNQ